MFSRNIILDVDLTGFLNLPFDAVSHEWLMRFVEHRIGERRINRLIANSRLIGRWMINRRSAGASPSLTRNWLSNRVATQGPPHDGLSSLPIPWAPLILPKQYSISRRH